MSTCEHCQTDITDAKPVRCGTCYRLVCRKGCKHKRIGNIKKHAVRKNKPMTDLDFEAEYAMREFELRAKTTLAIMDASRMYQQALKDIEQTFSEANS